MAKVKRNKPVKNTGRIFSDDHPLSIKVQHFDE
jgi:hypothetical protein